MATSKYQRPRQRLVQLLFLASASTATIIDIGGSSLTLSNFQLITQLFVPLGCLLAYNNPIQGCVSNDFATGATCSASCRRGLLRMQENLKDACEAVQVQINTLLGQALSGNLVGLLCPSNQAPTSAPPTVQPTSTMIVPPPSSSVVVAPPTPPTPPPPPPPATTTPAVIPPPATTTPVVISPPSQPPIVPPPSTAVPTISQPPQPPPPPPPPAPTTVVTSTTTSETVPQSTDAAASSAVNPLDALLLSNDAEAAFGNLSKACLSIALLTAAMLAS